MNTNRAHVVKSDMKEKVLGAMKKSRPVSADKKKIDAVRKSITHRKSTKS